MLYSVRMRAAKGGAHEAGGSHISGAERLIEESRLVEMAQEMIRRALLHSKGRADFIRLTIDQVEEKRIQRVPLLPIKTFSVESANVGRILAKKLLMEAGVSNVAAATGICALSNLRKNMRGAMAVCAETGQRLDVTGERGIRVSRMDVEDEKAYAAWLEHQGVGGIHAREAVVLAAKAIAGNAVVAELCWSDDPEYVTGYVASQGAYQRITKLKEHGSGLGGRVFFVRQDTDMEELIAYLEEQPVLVAEKRLMNA